VQGCTSHIPSTYLTQFKQAEVNIGTSEFFLVRYRHEQLVPCLCIESQHHFWSLRTFFEIPAASYSENSSQILYNIANSQKNRNPYSLETWLHVLKSTTHEKTRVRLALGLYCISMFTLASWRLHPRGEDVYPSVMEALPWSHKCSPLDRKVALWNHRCTPLSH
jgi:hypothetical protein